MGKLPRDLFEDELVPLCEKVKDGGLRLGVLRGPIMIVTSTATITTG